MRKIEILEWKERDRNDEEVDVNTVTLIRNMVRNIPLERMPRGPEAFELVRDLSKALDNADGKEHVILEESVYSHLEKHAFPQIPDRWGFIPGLSDAVLLIINAKKEDINE